MARCQTPAAQYADNAGTTKPAMNLDAPLFKQFGDEPRGSLFLETDLGMGMEIMSPRFHLRQL
jgi:hypothetical protein